MIALPDLHDASFLRLTLEWKTGDAELEFRSSAPASDVIRISGYSTTRVLCPRSNPWGSSVSVNAVSVESLGTEKVLIIEMQSGDVVEIRAKDFRVAVE